MNMGNIFWIIIVCIILGIIGWGSLLISCYRENKRKTQHPPLIDI